MRVHELRIKAKAENTIISINITRIYCPHFDILSLTIKSFSLKNKY